MGRVRAPLELQSPPVRGWAEPVGSLPAARAAITDRLIMDPLSLVLVSVMAGFTFFEAGLLVTLVILERASG
jgi:hypothetical protein